MHHLFLFLTLVTTALCQLDGMQPDVRFGEDNDRFDVDNIVQLQNKIYRQQMDDIEDEDDVQLERRYNSGGRKSHRRHHKHRSLPDGSLRPNSRRNHFLLQEDLDSYRADDDAESDAYQLNSKPFGRRFMKRRSEEKGQQLLSYAVPIHVKIQGYLQAPLDKQ